MPWKSVIPVQERMKFITLVNDEDASFAELCRRFGISRKTGYKWLNRDETEGPGGLAERPSVAAANARSLSDLLVNAIIAIRCEHPTWGPKKIRALLEQAGTSCLPSTSTVSAVLKRHGLVRPQRRRIRTSRAWSNLTIGEQPNDVWCVDFKGDFLLGDKTRCYPLTVSDFESRYLIACTALTSTKTLTARPMFERVFLEFGIPEVIRSDNGVPFSSVGVGGLSPLAVWWIKLGIRPERIEPGHPEQNGRHERMHRTMKAEATKPMQADLASQQRAFDRFRHQYNDIRPHEAIGLKTPLSRYSTSRRRMPHELVAPTYPESMSTRRLDRLGRINVRGIHIRIGPLVANETIGLLEVGDGFSEIFFGPLRLGAIDSRTKRPVLVGGPPKLPAL